MRWWRVGRDRVFRRFPRRHRTVLVSAGMYFPVKVTGGKHGFCLKRDRRLTPACIIRRRMLQHLPERLSHAPCLWRNANGRGRQSVRSRSHASHNSRCPVTAATLKFFHGGFKLPPGTQERDLQAVHCSAENCSSWDRPTSQPCPAC